MQWNQAEEENISSGSNHAEHSYNSLPLNSGSENEDDEAYENVGDGYDGSDDEDLSGISTGLTTRSGKIFFSPDKTCLTQPSSSKCSSALMIQITK